LDDIRLAVQFRRARRPARISGLFSIAETSMMAVNRYRLKALVRMERARSTRRAAREDR